MDPWLGNCLCWMWKRNLSSTGIVQRWLAVPWHQLMHQRAVAITLNILVQALAATPSTCPSAWLRQLIVLVLPHLFHDMRSYFMADEVDEGIAKVALATEIHRHVDEIKQAAVTSISEALHQARLRKVRREVAHHKSRLRLNRCITHHALTLRSVRALRPVA